jgi:hypothetical protein
MFRIIRTAALMLLLIIVGLRLYHERIRATSWTSSLQVVVYPVAGDSSAATADYIAQLSETSFTDIEDWLRAAAEQHGIKTIRPVALTLGPRIDSIPPAPPSAPSALSVALWSLQLRWWVWHHDPAGRSAPQVRLYVIYHAPDRLQQIPDSLGLQKGMTGIVHAYATRAQTRENNVVMTHELLHTLGATDKYDPATNLPKFPAGYADPERVPLLPQDKAEIMAGRIPLSAREATMPSGLSSAVLGSATAHEIGMAH